MIDTRKLLGIMAEQGVTQKSLAQKIKCSENTISLKIRGIKPFDTFEAERICEILCINDFAERAKIFLVASSQK